MILKGLNYKLKTLKMIDTNAKGNKLSSKFQVNILKKNFFNIRLKNEKETGRVIDLHLQSTSEYFLIKQSLLESLPNYLRGGSCCSSDKPSTPRSCSDIKTSSQNVRPFIFSYWITSCRSSHDHNWLRPVASGCHKPVFYILID